MRTRQVKSLKYSKESKELAFNCYAIIYLHSFHLCDIVFLLITDDCPTHLSIDDVSPRQENAVRESDPGTVLICGGGE